MFHFSIPQTLIQCKVVKGLKGELFLYNVRSSTLLATREREGEVKGVQRRQRRQSSARIQEAKDEDVGD